jgi:hypothetical protein
VKITCIIADVHLSYKPDHITYGACLNMWILTKTLTNLPAAFHTKEDWLGVWQRQKMRKILVRLKVRKYTSLPCLWEDNIKRDKLNRSFWVCRQGLVAGSCGRGNGHSPSICREGGWRSWLNYWLLTSQEGLWSTKVGIHKISVFMQEWIHTDKPCMSFVLNT